MERIPESTSVPLPKFRVGATVAFLGWRPPGTGTGPVVHVSSVDRVEAWLSDGVWFYGLRGFHDLVPEAKLTLVPDTAESLLVVGGRVAVVYPMSAPQSTYPS